MKTNTKNNIVLVLILTLFFSPLIFLIKKDIEFRKNNPKITFYSDYKIQSIRIDDDAEYHILAINSQGNVKELRDADNGYNIYVSFRNIDVPIIRYMLEGYNNDFTYVYKGYPQVILPIGYKIETFDD